MGKNNKKKIKWDQVGEKLYEIGVDRGVLYTQEGGVYGAGVPWNGLTQVTESPSGAEATKLYANNNPYLTLLSKEEWGGTIEAYTYPDEFAACDGSAEITTGVSIGQQKRKSFGFTYRSLIGNDTDGESHGYKIHLVYGCMASPSEKTRATINNDVGVDPMSWEISTTPVAVTDHDPTSTMEIDSTKVTAKQLAKIEEILYGKDPSGEATDDGVAPRMPLPDELIAILNTVTE